MAETHIPPGFIAGEEYYLGDPAEGLRGYRYQDGREDLIVGDHWDIVYAEAETHRGEPKRIWKEYWASGTGVPLRRVGKKLAGATLDGREHKQTPGAQNV